jgi:hypothetical protein
LGGGKVEEGEAGEAVLEEAAGCGEGEGAGAACYYTWGRARLVKGLGLMGSELQEKKKK